MDTAVAVCAHTGQLVEAARRVRARLDPCDPVQVGLRPLAEDGDPNDAAEAHRRAGSLIAHLAGWPAPGRPGLTDAVAAGGIGRAGEGWEEEIGAWLAAMMALQAVEVGAESALGRALAAGAVALWHGEPEGLSWLAAAVRLSRLPGPF